MKTRAKRTALAAATLLLVAAVVLIGLRRPVSTEVGPGPVTSVIAPSSDRPGEPASRPPRTSPAGSAEVDDRASEPVTLPSIDESPDMYATGTAARSAEAQSELQLEAPTSPDPQFPYDPEPPLSPYESPTDAAFEAGMPQSPVGEPHDEAPTSLSFESPAAPATDAAATDQDASPTEAPPD